MRRFLGPAVMALVLLSPSNGFGADRPDGEMFATRSVVYGRSGMVAAAHPVAVSIGIDVLKRGGSAVDAAIAVNAALGFLEPTACGIGGDLFAVVWDADSKRLYGLNASGRAPAALTADRVPAAEDGTIPLYTPWAWTIPGTVDGWTTLHGRFGVLPLQGLLAPAIRAAREGEPVPQVIADGWATSAAVFREKPGFASTFLPGGRAPRTGEVFRNPDLAKSLERIAAGGADAFYRGAIAEAIVAFSEANGGSITLEDLAAHRSEWVEPISTSYRGVELWELPPNGQGIAALEMLNILENFDLQAMGRDSVDFWHVMVEAKKIVYADRARYYADPAFVKVPVEQLLSKDYAKKRAALVDMRRAAMTDQPGDVAVLNRKETTYLCTADESGLMVSLIQSNYSGFGSGYAVPEVGIGLQNRGACFALKAGHPNRLEPGKRPFHTIIPAFLTKDGAPLMAFGLMGGDMQPQGHAQVLVNLIDFGMNLQEAGDAIRFHHEDSSEPMGTVMKDGGLLHIEDGLPAALLEDLARRGHVMKPEPVGAYGGYQAIWRDPVTGHYVGATEKRKDGCAAGY